MTLGIYTHARPEALGAAVARLPMPGQGTANPLSHLSRGELEGLALALLAVLGTVLAPPADLVTPRVTPPAGSSGDSGGPVGSGTGLLRAG